LLPDEEETVEDKRKKYPEKLFIVVASFSQRQHSGHQDNFVG